MGRNARYMINERQAVDLLLPKVYFMRKIVITRIQKWAAFLRRTTAKVRGVMGHGYLLEASSGRHIPQDRFFAIQQRWLSLTVPKCGRVRQ